MGATENFLCFSIIYLQLQNHSEIGRTAIADPVICDSFHSILQSVTTNVTQHRFSAEVRRDFFSLLTLLDFFASSVQAIALPLMRIETSQKCAKGVHLRDLADCLDKPRQVRRGDEGQP
ncbi:pyocin activator PrtN family protein [Devosia sp.]|uniref:pyocin activator PrtN family protein n=1 Tax=Devosia sp. TaxID=1871048 RepID=UPI003FA572D2